MITTQFIEDLQMIYARLNFKQWFCIAKAKSVHGPPDRFDPIWLKQTYGRLYSQSGVKPTKMYEQYFLNDKRQQQQNWINLVLKQTDPEVDEINQIEPENNGYQYQQMCNFSFY